MKKIIKITVLICSLCVSSDLIAQNSRNVCELYSKVYNYINDGTVLEKLKNQVDSTDLPVNVIPEFYKYSLENNHECKILDETVLCCVSKYVFRRNVNSRYFMAFSQYENNKIYVVLAYFHNFDISDLKFATPSLEDIGLSNLGIHLELNKKNNCLVMTFEFEFDNIGNIIKVDDVSEEGL